MKAEQDKIQPVILRKTWIGHDLVTVCEYLLLTFQNNAQWKWYQLFDVSKSSLGIENRSKVILYYISISFRIGSG